MGEIGRVQCLIIINYINVDRHNEDTGGTTMVLYVLYWLHLRHGDANSTILLHN